MLLNSKVHFVSETSSGGKTQDYLKPQKKGNAFKKAINVKKNRPCFYCGKKGHYIKECRYINNAFKKGNSNGANQVENEVKELIAMVSDMKIRMITEINMATTTTKFVDW